MEKDEARARLERHLGFAWDAGTKGGKDGINHGMKLADAYAQAAVDKFKADTLGLRSSLSQMVFWAICYQQDSKESTFMDAGHKKWIAREIAEAEALLGEGKEER
jgi:hypothetical protein